MKANNRLVALFLIALFVGIGVAYSLVVPPFETPDEPFHYAFARHIAQGNGLPVQSEQSTGPWGQEGSQAPLYYLLTGWLTRGIDQEDFGAVAVRNERANIGDPLTPGNKNFMLYSGRQPPLQGSNLALHLGRWFSLLLAALTLWFTYLTAELACSHSSEGPSHTKAVSSQMPPCSVPLLAVALVAAIPQFIFISAAFTNDNLIMAASAATIFWLARLLARRDEAPIHLWEWLILGLLLGIAALSKLQGLGLIPLAGGVVLFLAWKRRDWRLPFVALLLVALPALAIAGWWYARNVALYGDWSGLSHLKAINGLRTETLTWEDFWPEFRGLRYSFWGLYGWFNILLPDWFYAVMDAVTLVGLAGLVGVFGYWGVEAVRGANTLIAPTSQTQPAPTPARRVTLSPRILVLLLLWAAESFALLIYWTLQATAARGGCSSQA